MDNAPIAATEHTPHGPLRVGSSPGQVRGNKPARRGCPENPLPATPNRSGNSGRQKPAVGPSPLDALRARLHGSPRRGCPSPGLGSAIIRSTTHIRQLASKWFFVSVLALNMIRISHASDSPKEPMTCLPRQARPIGPNNRPTWTMAKATFLPGAVVLKKSFRNVCHLSFCR